MKKAEIYQTPLSVETEVNSIYVLCTSPDQVSAGEFEETEFELL